MPSTAGTRSGSEDTAGTGLADRVVAAYGGEERWRAARQVDVRLDAGGALFRWKRGRIFRDLRIQGNVWDPCVRMHPFYDPSRVGVLDGGDVRIESPDGAVLESRSDARRYFPYGRRLFHWDELDMAYFFGYALWNYLTLPALILRDDIEWRELSDTILEATFPPGLPTHCPVAQFRFDPRTGLLERYDYTAEVFGSWAVANHETPEHKTNEQGIPYASKRRVKPRMPGGEGSMPALLIWADLHEFHLNGGTA